MYRSENYSYVTDSVDEKDNIRPVVSLPASCIDTSTGDGLSKSTAWGVKDKNGDEDAYTVNMSGYTYGRTVSTPSITGDTGDRTVTYYYNSFNSNSNGSEWSNITSTSLNAGTYYMYAKIAADEDNSAVTTAPVAFTISKATPTWTLSSSSLTLDVGDTATLTVTSGPTSTLSASPADATTATTTGSGGTSITVTGVAAGSTTLTVTIPATTNYTSGIKTVSVTVEQASLPTTESGEGYYADVDGDGTVDGIIYADLAQDGSGEWVSSIYGSYSWSAVSNLKSYEVSQEGYSDDFGTKDVLKATSTSGNDRFYVMALDDITTSSNSTFYWYYYGYANLSSSNTVGGNTNDFGQGKADTINVKSWNDSGTYGNANSRDLWQLWKAGGSVTSANNSKTYKMISSASDTGGKWFVPSKAEWAAFGDYAFTEEGVTTSTYGKFGLSDYYWSSALRNFSTAYFASFYTGEIMSGGGVSSDLPVRLSTTF